MAWLLSVRRIIAFQLFWISNRSFWDILRRVRRHITYATISTSMAIKIATRIRIIFIFCIYFCFWTVICMIYVILYFINHLKPANLFIFVFDCDLCDLNDLHETFYINHLKPVNLFCDEWEFWD